MSPAPHQNSKVRVGGMHWPQTGATHYHAQLGLPNKGLVVCYVVWLGYMIYGMGIWTSTRCVSLVFVVVRIQQRPKDLEIQYNTQTKLLTHCPNPVSM